MIKTIKLFKKGLPVVLLSLIVLLSVFQPLPSGAAAERVYVNAEHVSPFYLGGNTYIFGKQWNRDIDDFKTLDNAANWWAIKAEPKYGFSPVAVRKKMSSKYQAITPFTLNNKQYIFGLHSCTEYDHKSVPHCKGDYNANIWRIDTVDGEAKGWTLMKINGKTASGKMASAYKAVVSYQLNGEPYILGLHGDVGASIWSVTEASDGVKFDLKKYKAAKMSGGRFLAVYYKDGHPYVFEGVNIWRVMDLPAYGLELKKKGVKFPGEYRFVTSFHIGDQPYLFAAAQPPDQYREITIPTNRFEFLKSIFDTEKAVYDCVANKDCGLYEPGKGYGVIYKVEVDRITQISPKTPISNHYRDMTTFEQGGKAYIFGSYGWDDKYANIWQVNEKPETGFSLIYYGKTGKTIGQP